MATSVAAVPGTGPFDGKSGGLTGAVIRIGDTVGLRGTTGAASRGGVAQALSNPLKYDTNGNLTGTLRAGRYFFPAPDSANGMHVLELLTDTILTHPTPNATNPRRDLIIAEVGDYGDSTSFKQFRILPGTPASSPVDPTWSAEAGKPATLGNGGYAVLARVPIAANASALGTIVDLRTYAAQGTQIVADLTEATALPEGVHFYMMSTDQMGVKKASGVQLVPLGGYANGDWASYVMTAAAQPNVLTAIGNDSVIRRGGTLTTSDVAEVGGPMLRLNKLGLYYVTLSTFLTPSSGTWRRFIEFETDDDPVWNTRGTGQVDEDRWSCSGMIKVSAPLNLQLNAYQFSEITGTFTTEVKLMRVDLA